MNSGLTDGERGQQLCKIRHSFTVSIEAKEGVTTGISAHDRAQTVRVANDPTKGAEDLARPGHIFPLRARDGGVLVRTGQTEVLLTLPEWQGFPITVLLSVRS